MSEGLPAHPSPQPPPRFGEEGWGTGLRNCRRNSWASSSADACLASDWRFMAQKTTASSSAGMSGQRLRGAGGVWKQTLSIT